MALGYSLMAPKLLSVTLSRELGLLHQFSESASCLCLPRRLGMLETGEVKGPTDSLSDCCSSAVPLSVHMLLVILNLGTICFFFLFVKKRL